MVLGAVALVSGVGLAFGGTDDEADPPTTDSTTTTVPVTTAPASTVPTSIVPTSTVPVPEPPVPAAERLEGTHRGIEHYSPGSGACVLDHVLDSTFDVAGGSSWQYHAEYCGAVDGDLWTGTGTFVITAPDRATLVGTLASSARLPTDGEPYQLTITGGTGRFAGASGTCTLDNHLTVVGDGVQEQFGTFVCDIG